MTMRNNGERGNFPYDENSSFPITLKQFYCLQINICKANRLLFRSFS